MVDQRQATAPTARSASKPAPSRSPDEVTRDIAIERVALDKAFADLQNDLGEAVGAARERARAAGRKALIVGPAVGAAVGGLAVGVAFLNRRRRRTRH